MRTENITSRVQRDDRSVELTITDPFEGTTEVKRYAAVRGGICWPTTDAPAYCCILAQEYVVQQVFCDVPRPGTRILLAEHESEALNLTNFYEKICDLGKMMMCQDWYCELPEDRWSSGYLSDFDDYCRRRKSHVTLLPAYDVDNLVLGVSRIKGNIDEGLLTLTEDSIVHAQLRSLTRDDLGSPDSLFAIHGLRHVVSSYFRDSPSLISQRQGRLQRKLRNLSPTSFMSS